MIDKQKHTDIKTDERPQKGLWAPGNYLRRCNSCGDRFIGDKRAVYCADCEYDSYDQRKKALYTIAIAIIIVLGIIYAGRFSDYLNMILVKGAL